MCSLQLSKVRKIKTQNCWKWCVKCGQQWDLLSQLPPRGDFPCYYSFPFAQQNVSYRSRPDLCVHVIYGHECAQLRHTHVDKSQKCLQLETASAVFIWSDSSETVHSVNARVLLQLLCDCYNRTHMVCKLFRQIVLCKNEIAKLCPQTICEIYVSRKFVHI